jgi:hypothetical protein
MAVVLLQNLRSVPCAAGANPGSQQGTGQAPTGGSPNPAPQALLPPQRCSPRKQNLRQLPQASVVPELSAKRETLDTSRAEYLFANNTGGIESITLFLHLGANEQSLFLDKDWVFPSARFATAWHPLEGFAMKRGQGEGLLQLPPIDPDGLGITKTFTLPQTVGSPEDTWWALTSPSPTAARPPFPCPVISWLPGAAPVHINDLPIYTCFDWYRDGKMTSIDVNWFDAGTIPIVGIQTRPARDLYSQPEVGILWAGVASQYFCTLVMAPKEQPADRGVLGPPL